MTRVRAVAALEVPPHDPVAGHPAVRAGQQQAGRLGAGQPADVLTGLDVDVGAGVLPPQVIRQRLRDHPDPADHHAAGDRCADNLQVVAPLLRPGVAGRLPLGEARVRLVVGRWPGQPHPVRRAAAYGTGAGDGANEVPAGSPGILYSAFHGEAVGSPGWPCGDTPWLSHLASYGRPW